MKMVNLAIGLVCMFLFGCDLLDPYPKVEFDRTTFEQKWARWEKTNIANYTFDGKEFRGKPAHRFCITVTDRNVADFKNLINDPGELCSVCGNSRICDQPPVTGYWTTISGLYAWVAEQYDSYNKRVSELKKKEYFYINIQYNNQYHYPEYISMGVGSYSGSMDGYWAFSISNFLPKP